MGFYPNVRPGYHPFEPAKFARNTSMKAAPVVKCLVFTIAMLVVRASVRAELPRDPPGKGDSLQTVFDRIREHAKDDSWRKAGWKDELIEKWLEQFVAAVAKATETPDLKLPARQADVQPADLARPFALPQALIICKDAP